MRALARDTLAMDLEAFRLTSPTNDDVPGQLAGGIVSSPCHHADFSTSSAKSRRMPPQPFGESTAERMPAAPAP